MFPVLATMRAAVYEPGKIELVLSKEHQIRPLEDDEILLKVSVCGRVTLDTQTYIMGHEVSGKPILLGSKANKRKIHLGKLYTVLSPACGARSANDGLLFEDIYGFGLDGGYAEYIIVKEANLILVPEGVTPEAAAVAGDAGITAYDAVKYTAKVTKGTKVLIFGIGGLGPSSCSPEARQLALHVGADEAFDLIELNTKTSAGFTVDCTVDFVATNQTYTPAMSALSGNDVKFPVTPRLVLVGISAENLTLSTVNIISTQVQVLPSAYGPKRALKEVLELFAKGIVRAHAVSEPLENINKVINDLRALGRKVIVPS